MKKRTLAGITVLAAAIFASGCGSSGSAATTAAAPAETAAPAEAAAEPVHVTIGVTGTVHEDIWSAAVDNLEKEGIEAELVQFSDYVLPNNALDNHEIDLNAFQHTLYLNAEIEQHGYKLQPIAYEYSTHLNLFSQKISSVDEIKDGDTIAIPNDVTNGGAALKILQDAGLLTFSEDAAFNPTEEDVVSRKVDFEITPLAPSTIPSALADVTAAIVNVNYAIDYGFKMEDALFVGDLKERDYWTVIAARTEDLSDPDKVALYDTIIKAFQSDGTAKVYEEKFGGYYEPAGWDIDLLAEYR